MNLFNKLVWQIEMRLKDQVTLDDLAARCAVSPYHLARGFRAVAGMGPMTYLRARRLSEAAKALAEGDREILEIALDYQYGSHAAFTRAFSAWFGVLPRTVRQTRRLDTLTLMEPLTMDKSSFLPVAAPRLTDRAAFTVTGLTTDATAEDNSTIPPLWQAFNARYHEFDPGTVGPAYGLCHGMTEDGGFRYMAGAETSGTVPKGMEQVRVPAARYAVFTHDGHIADLPSFVHSVWNRGLTEAGLEPTMAPEFELYDGRFDPEAGRGVIELWIPVRA